MAIVEPCSSSLTASGARPASRRQSTTPRVGASAVVALFEQTSPCSPSATRSVKVPPMSTPTTTRAPSSFTTSPPPPRKPQLRAARELIQHPRDAAQEQKQGKQSRRIEAFRVELREVADAVNRGIQLGENHTEQGHRHRESHATEQVR